MKRIIPLIFVLFTVSCLSALSEEAKQMMVTNCENYASLREKPDSSAERVAKVPYLEVVDVYRFEGAYAYCHYDGTYGYILKEQLKEVPYEYNYADTDIEGVNAFIREVNERMGYEFLTNVREEIDYISDDPQTVADIAGTHNATLRIMHDQLYFMIHADIEDIHNPALREAYTEAGSYYVTNDKTVVEEMYDELAQEFDEALRREQGQSRVIVEHNDRVGRYFCYLNYGESQLDGIKMFMGELQ